ncbi:MULTISPECIES: MarR family winged helix-turn-helix transcriptional regulator [Dactylosporangium]|uniref:MarR family transcriptional regulator n=2 Tax=Dactylosporangium TaxID=35753 RepID=A0A9W6NLW1_9ACTN|nr:MULTISPECIES: MarR family transcriptional regulator [Dactylosporangium]UAB99355.1 MarR family transcriptional regulator [Dactylosporangium vinaceum]UWZ47584.1 MarR family transcriptional regulator [Dactylosporangium matsuzakiense]GLL01586.1 MarR family transcriptional regulator [Dactylosporangium matsuzakiense]
MDDNDLIDALAQTAFTVMAALNRVGAEHDLSLTQLRVLGILRDRRMRISELAEYLGLEKSTITGLVDRAEKRGLLARAPSATDGRAVDVFITPAGEALAGPAYDHLVELLSPLLAALEPAERRRLGQSLRAMLGPEAG